MSIKDECIKSLRELRDKWVKELSPYIKHFDVGDEAWVMNEDEYEPMLVTILDVTQTHEGGKYFYWYHNCGHGMLAGRGNDLYKDRTECLIDYDFYNASLNINNLVFFDEFLEKKNAKKDA